jgi:hypothetical protein
MRTAFCYEEQHTAYGLWPRRQTCVNSTFADEQMSVTDAKGDRLAGGTDARRRELRDSDDQIFGFADPVMGRTPNIN